MIKVMMGEKGSGKTKAFINKVNQAIDVEKGNVVCISKGSRYLFDLHSQVRMADTADFDIQNYDAFYGFICGIISRDYDITHIFIDSVTKITGEGGDALDRFITQLEQISNQFNIAFTMTISDHAQHASEQVRQHLIEF